LWLLAATLPRQSTGRITLSSHHLPRNLGLHFAPKAIPPSCAGGRNSLEEGLSAGALYHRIEDAYYARNFEIRCREEDRSDHMVTCNSVNALVRSTVGADLREPIAGCLPEKLPQGWGGIINVTTSFGKANPVLLNRA
jgi:hypothetical protein